MRAGNIQKRHPVLLACIDGESAGAAVVKRGNTSAGMGETFRFVPTRSVYTSSSADTMICLGVQEFLKRLKSYKNWQYPESVAVLPDFQGRGIEKSLIHRDYSIDCRVTFIRKYRGQNTTHICMNGGGPHCTLAGHDAVGVYTMIRRNTFFSAEKKGDRGE
jgi:GNAT superfamily N-acetyltransferase